jgi:hypothetical protein
LEASQQFSFLQGGVVSPTPNPHPGGPGLCIYIPQRQGGNQIKEDEIDGICGTNGRQEKCIENFSREPEGRTNRSWEDNIRMCLTEIRWEDIDWIHLAQDSDQ